jgi:hypothetical protein
MRAPGLIDVVVLGAGPYGLSIGAHLAARGAAFRMFGQVMQSWRTNMPQGMYLKSPGRASNLSDPLAEHTLAQFCKSTGSAYSDWEHPVSRELFIRYGDWFQKSLIPEIDPRQILSCEAASDGFLLQLEGGETIGAKAVVVSSGYMTSPRMPQELEGLHADLVSHSSAHSSFAQFRDKDVIVIGAGQSALETAALLLESGARPSLVARSGIVWGGPEKADRTLYERLRYPRTALSFGWRFVFYEHGWAPFYYLPASLRRKHVETALGPLGAWWLRERVVDRMPILLGWTLGEARTRSDRVVLGLQRSDQTLELQADHVIAATGYRVRPASFPFLSAGLRQAIRWQHGSPLLSRYFESSVPGLHFTGLASAYSFGPVMRFVAGAHVTAARLGWRLAIRHARYSPRSPVLAPALR